jgi:hypothetical protein
LNTTDNFLGQTLRFPDIVEFRGDVSWISERNGHFDHEFRAVPLIPPAPFSATSMLPPELLDQITSLNTQHRELLSIIHKLSRHTEIRSQLDLDDLVLQIKAKFVEADQVIEVRDLTFLCLTT